MTILFAWVTFFWPPFEKKEILNKNYAIADILHDAKHTAIRLKEFVYLYAFVTMVFYIALRSK